MKPFRNLPIQRKMLVLTLLICGSVLIVAIAALFLFEVVSFRSNFQRNTSMLAAIIANNSTAALAFHDTNGGAEVVGALQAVPTVESASLITPDGSLFAQFGKASDARSRTQFPPAGQGRFTGDYLLFTQPVVLDDKRVGTLFLRSNFREPFTRLLTFYGLMILAVTVVSITLAVKLSGRLQLVITGPVLHLAAIAQTVGEKKDYSLRATVSSHGDELGRLTESFNEMLSRIESQEQKLQALIHSIDGIVWECDPEQFQFSFISRQCERILGFSPEQWLADADFWRFHLHPEDEARVIQTRRDYGLAGTPYTCEYRLRAADGRMVWIRESGSVLVEQGKTTALRGIFLDITGQKTAADELERLNRRLLETSRYAGMAEVATGVLHNVGNVLNSVSVSATLVADRLKQSKIANLRRAATMLREQNGGLAEFLTTNPKGKVLPEYLCQATNELTAEQTEMAAEMESVGQNIEHIKEIVAMQQNYAKVSGAYENLTAAGLVEDSLRINTAAFDRHRIEVVREFDAATPLVCVDRHKTLQILINLVSNAKYAMDEDASLARRLVIRVGSASPDRVKIAICDSGVGIIPENLIKIFNYGFTTKKNGHGFGLHSCANAAKEMGGSLVAQSDGPGLGASFILELPVAKATRAGEIPAKQGTV